MAAHWLFFSIQKVCLRTKSGRRRNKFSVHMQCAKQVHALQAGASWQNFALGIAETQWHLRKIRMCLRCIFTKNTVYNTLQCIIQ